MPTITTRLTFAYTSVCAAIIAVVMATIYSRFDVRMRENIDGELRRMDRAVSVLPTD